MFHPVIGIDHCFCLVEDLDAAARLYRKLGFTLSPRGTHSAALGTANYTIMFQDDYLELLGVIAPTELNAARRDSLAESGEGLYAIAARVASARTAGPFLAAFGIKTEALKAFSRPVDLPDGTRATAAFETLAFSGDQVPQGMLFMCEHLTRETVWLPELQEHPNTACGLGGILAMSEKPEQDANRFARLWADGVVSRSNGLYVVDTGKNSAPLILTDRGQMAVLYPNVDLALTPKGSFTALRIKVKDPRTAMHRLKAAAIDPVATQTGFAVSPAVAAGVILEFVPND